ncbi:MAG: alpha-amylase [Proteobacteria bacterium]|nr:alpha-amylase [Pseudomonadota bacterium]
MSLAAALLLGAAAPLAQPAPPPQPAPLAELRARALEQEVIYFVLPDRFANGDPANDRGGLAGDRLVTGFDPAAKGFYHGGDLKGLIAHLDYIQGLGASAIWLGPIFKNKPVQGDPGHESAGYHGYWITDFTQVDPHFGSNADFQALVDAVHARGMKLYMDIVVNHTADVIQYRECVGRPCPYRSRADYPYQRRGGVAGAPINPGFAGDGLGSAENFARLTNPAFAYTPFVPPGEAHAKTPDWLNDPIYYHNRGETTYEGESATMGDFSGLDDVMTENPRVIAGFIDIYGGWIDRYGIDGFRIDTARHVDAAFWRAFIPAMLARARARGIPNFHIFGEVSGHDHNEVRQAVATHVAAYPAVLDFALHDGLAAVLGGRSGTDRLEELFAADPLYQGGEAGASATVTWVSNHDDGRIAQAIRAALPQASLAEVQARVALGHAMLLTLRGVPAIYAGDEQGFIGRGGDQDARQDLFASQVAQYNAEEVPGGPAGSRDRFDRAHPLYRMIADLARLRRGSPALRQGRQVVRARSTEPGLFAVSRFDPATGAEVLVAFNTATRPLTAQIEVETASLRFATLAGTCPASAAAPGSATLVLPPLSFAVCAAQPPAK